MKCNEMNLPGARSLFMAAGVLFLSVGCGGSGQGDEAPRGGEHGVKNVIMLGVDTVRWDSWWIPERTGTTDEFSQWARGSQVLSRSVSAAPWTVPSVGSVLTGLYPSQHGGGLFDRPVANLDKHIPSAISGAVPTLAEILASVGVQTAAVSAHPWFDANYGFERGFENLYLRKGAESVTRRGLEWLDERSSDSPYFLYLHYMDAHDKHLNLPAARTAVESMDGSLRERLLSTAPKPACDDPEGVMCIRYLSYAKATLDLRRSMAHLLDELRARGELEDSLVVLYSDHGEAFHDHREMAESRAVDPRGFYGFGHGQSLYQEQLHVPLMVWHPDLQGLDMATPVSLVDVLPSVLDWMGISLPEQIEYPGRSFAGLVEQQGPGAFEWREESLKFPASQERELFASGIAYGPEQMAVISEGFKLIWHEADNAREFYNLAEDPREKNSLPGDAVPPADELDAELGEYFDWFGSQDYLPPELSDDVVERLKGVGYLQGVESSGESEDAGSEGESDQGDGEP
ncbi:MAG: sulfatase-like hydrolase/transferase [Gammaproteobacteria bacterium]|jgi:arylsulfatase A-like enzyme|nr:sulfatase-like hydrolase/transferase [Gammaproteobacteria bacterium]